MDYKLMDHSEGAAVRARTNRLEVCLPPLEVRNKEIMIQFQYLHKNITHIMKIIRLTQNENKTTEQENLLMSLWPASTPAHPEQLVPVSKRNSSRQYLNIKPNLFWAPKNLEIFCLRVHYQKQIETAVVISIWKWFKKKKKRRLLSALLIYKGKSAERARYQGWKQLHNHRNSYFLCGRNTEEQYKQNSQRYINATSITNENFQALAIF